MVRLLKLLFYLSGASCFSGFEYSLSSSCGFMVLRKNRSFGVIIIFCFFLWDISTQPSCSMLRRHRSKVNKLNRNKRPFLYISSFIPFSLNQKNKNR